jgi:cell division septation protein DedD
MKIIPALLLASAVALCSLSAVAQQAAVVEGVQMPAWLERSEGGAPARRIPLAAGMELKGGDQLYTGAGSRLVVKLSEGSLVKLGENASLRIAELQPSKDLFKAVMSVLEGAFRFTTDKVIQKRRRDINIHVSQVTAGIRGTDLWGRSREDNQIVCLIEGAIEVGAPGEQPVALDKPLQFYQREKGQARPVAFVAAKQLAEWSKETEIEAGKGASRRGGKWQVVLASADNPGSALTLYDQLRAAGYAAEILPTKEAEQLVYLVRIRKLPSRAEARALAAQLRGKHGVAEPRVPG